MAGVTEEPSSMAERVAYAFADRMTPKPIIAIADDESVAREVLAGALEDRYEVRIFDRGQAVLDFAASHHADMVLLDVEMPSLSGYDTCRALRAGSTLPDVPVIFLSAHARLEDRLLGYAAGGHDYLVKPYDLDELNAKILLAIDAHRRARQLAEEVAGMSEAVSVTTEMMGEIGVDLRAPAQERRQPQVLEHRRRPEADLDARVAGGARVDRRHHPPHRAGQPRVDPAGG